MIRLSVVVQDILFTLEQYNQVKVYRASSEAGTYSEVSTPETRIVLNPATTGYFFIDDDGTTSNWYKTSFYNSYTLEESVPSSAMQGGNEEEKIGYTFKNYTPPSGEWGQIVTADDLRFSWLYGIDLVASDEATSEVRDQQLEAWVESAMEEFEHLFNICIRKRVYKTQPSESLLRSPEWREGVDYTHEEDPYDFKHQMWQKFGFLRLRHRPVISIESAKLYSPWDSQILDLIEWVRLYKEAGHVSFFPKGSTMSGMGYTGAGLMAASPHMFNSDYPQGFKIDYTVGFPSSDYVPRDLRMAIGTLAAIGCLNWIGDGLAAGFSSSSVSLDGLSESFSSTQSATSAFFGARIKAYSDQIKDFINKNKNKYCNVAMGFVGA